MMDRSTKTQENYARSHADKPHVLVIDDDTRIRDLVVRYLVKHDFIALFAQDAAQAREILSDFDVDVMVVDVMMPGETGVEFVRSIRAQGNTLPVIMLTALGEIDDRINGLEAGADDYLAKPFEPRELLLRLHAILKRSQTAKANTSQAFKIGPWLFAAEENALIDDAADRRIALTTMDMRLLNALSAKAGEVISREDLAEKCGADAGERNIDVQIMRLRKKIETDTKNPRYLQTLRGQGYLLRLEWV